MAYQSTSLAVPAIQWLGVHPNDIKSFILPSTALSKSDGARLDSLLVRPYLSQQIKEQLECMQRNKLKVEIEALSTLGNHYITNVYLPNKICAKKYI